MDLQILQRLRLIKRLIPGPQIRIHEFTKRSLGLSPSQLWDRTVMIRCHSAIQIKLLFFQIDRLLLQLLNFIRDVLAREVDLGNVFD